MLKALFFLLLLPGIPDMQQPNVVEQIARSGRCAVLAESPDTRVGSGPALKPGPPPLLTFRLYEGQKRQRFANSDLMLDDAGH